MSSSESEVEENLPEQQSDEENEETNAGNGEVQVNGDDSDKPVSWSDLVCNTFS